jgi:hypothetical protein
MEPLLYKKNLKADSTFRYLEYMETTRQWLMEVVAS